MDLKRKRNKVNTFCEEKGIQRAQSRKTVTSKITSTVTYTRKHFK